MSIYHVDSHQIATAALTADQSAAAIRTEVAQMLAFLGGLNDSWGGTAASSFHGLLEQWRMTQVQVEESLTAISTQLNHASQTYADAESAATSLFAG